jgi:hypothetical protein
MEGRATEVRNIVIELLSQLRMSLGQLKLYPANSPQAQKALLPAQTLVATFPGGAQGKIVLARTLRGFLVNSKRLPASDATALMESYWLQVFQDAHVNSLVIQTSITVEELTEFMDGLSRRFWDLKDGKGINARLRDARVLHAWVEEVQFVAMSKGDLLIEGAANKLAAAGARVAEIVETLEGVIDSTADEGIAEQVRLEIMRKLIEQDPTLIAKAQAMAFAVHEDEHEEGGGIGIGIGSGGGGGGGDGDGSGGGGGNGTGGGSGDGSGTGTGTGSGTGTGTGSGTGTGTGDGSGSGSGSGTGTGSGSGS